jgi:hypothetical protein
VSDIPDQDGDVDWKAVVNLLREGKTVEVPCAEERDYARRTRQVVKKTGKRNIAVDVHRGEGVLRIEPRPTATDSAAAQDMGAGETPTPPK